jgi:hypothetical protein
LSAVPSPFVALDDQAGRGVEHVEIADGRRSRLQWELPVAARPLFLGHREFQDAQHGAAADLLPVLGVGVPERPFEQAVEESAVGEAAKPSYPFERARLTAGWLSPGFGAATV